MEDTHTHIYIYIHYINMCVLTYPKGDSGTLHIENIETMKPACGTGKAVFFPLSSQKLDFSRSTILD